MGDHSLRLLQLAGHTGADLAILDETTGVLFAGDLVFYGQRPDHTNSPGLEIWLRDLDTLQALPWKQIVPATARSRPTPGPLHRCATTWAGSTN